jgi:hypothetical protein
MMRFILVGVVGLTLCLTGCAATSSTPQGTTFSVESFAAVAPRAEFAKVAKASCDKAMAEGVVEKSTAPDGFTLVMVPKDQGYQDFSAAFLAEPDDYQLIYEVDAFSACSADMQFSLAEEGGGVVDMEIEYDLNDGSFVTTQDLGEFGINKLEYQTQDGLFVGVKTLDDSKADPRTITYGYSEQDLQILITAVDEFLATEQ